MKTTVLFCVFLIAAATASEKTVRRAARKEKASSRFKQDVAAPNRPNPLKPFPDTPRQPDLDFIRTKVAELVKDFHIDQEQADMVSDGDGERRVQLQHSTRCTETTVATLCLFAISVNVQKATPGSLGLFACSRLE